MDNPRVSVVVPVFNGERYLQQAIESALGQSYPPHEVIVVDDGSTDSSPMIAESFGRSVTYVLQANQGPSIARNLGIERAASEWVAFLDADDYWLPDKLARQTAVIRDDADVDIVYSGFTRLAEGDASEESNAKPPECVKKRLAFECPLIPSTVLARRSLLLKHPWSTDFRSSEDWWLFYQLSRNAKFAAVEETTTFYRLHGESLTHSDWRSVLKYALLVSGKIQQDFTGLELILLKRRVYARLFANAALAAREHESRKSLGLIGRSLLEWPFPNVSPFRYKTFLKMLMH